ncbi:MAG: carboxypeptidase-like regulatory domain-containing protein, partial [Muriicola sp.]
KSKAKFTGKLYISANDYAVLKADYSFSEGREGRKFNMKLLLGIKYLENRNQGTIIFKIRTDGKYHPYYIKREFGNYVYLHRPLKFIENSDERNKVIFDFTLEGDGREKKELLLLDNEVLSPTEYKNFKEQAVIPYSLLKQFEPTIWQNNQIIEPLEEMKNFKAND